MKIHHVALNRFKITKTGKVLRRTATMRHLRRRKTKKQIRRYKVLKRVKGKFATKIKRMLGRA